MLLCVNVSNSKITLGIFEQEKLKFKSHLSSVLTRTAEEYAILLQSLLHLHHVQATQICGVIISCVVPALTPVIKSAISHLYSGRIFIVGPKLKTGLKIKSDNPSQIGSGLICQSVAILQNYSAPALLISMETALSMFILDENHTFIGGAILPSIQLGAKALNDYTAQLPQIDLSQKPRSVIGNNTVQNVHSGLIIGTACTINGMIAKFEEELKTSLTCIATGDFTKEVLSFCNPKIIYDENLVLEGLKIIYTKNQG